MPLLCRFPQLLSLSLSLPLSLSPVAQTKNLQLEFATDSQVASLRRIAADFAGKRPLVLGVLKGCFMFFSDLCKAIDPVPDGCEVHFMRASSYEGKVTETSHDVQLTLLGLDASQLRDRHVIVVSPTDTHSFPASPPVLPSTRRPARFSSHGAKKREEE